MASSSSTSPETSNAPSVKDHVNLQILSPSSEAPDKLLLEKIPTSLTVGELRRRITHETQGRLVPGRQRLIYQGRPLLNETAAIRDVFTQVAVSPNLGRQSALALTYICRSMVRTFSHCT